MEVTEQIERFRDFIEANYKKELHNVVSTGKKAVIFDFSKLLSFDPDLADLTLDEPEELFKAAEMSLENFDLPNANLRVRFTNLPKTQEIKIRDIRSVHLAKFLVFDGIVRQSSDVRPQVVNAKFECPSCGNTITILQLETRFKEPSRCSCGRRGKFRLIDKELVDVQRLVVEEAPERLEGGEQPKRLSIFLKEDLVEPFMERKTTPGSKVRIIGIIKEIPVPLKSGVPSTRYDLIAETNNIEIVEQTFEDIEVNKEDEEEIKLLAKDKNVYKKLINSIAPSIYGHEDIKAALVLQLMGGVKKVRKDGTEIRGNIHCLLVGDPGSAKCVHGDTKIVLSDGLIKSAKDLVDENLKNSKSVDDGLFSETLIELPSLSFDAKNRINKCNYVWKRKSPECLYSIVSETGNEIIVTPIHPMFLTRDGAIYSEKTENLKTGDFIACPRILDLNLKVQEINISIERTKAYNGIHITTPKHCDNNFARFLGYIISDSYVCYTTTSGEVIFTNNDEQLLNDFKCVSESIFNVSCRFKKPRKDKTAKELKIISIELLRFLEKLDSTLLKRAKYKKIPDIILKSPNFIVKDFLKALFDCEATVSNNKRVIVISSASKGLIYDLRMLLLRFGIISQIRHTLNYARNTKLRIVRSYWLLTISGENIIKYANNIGFTSIFKQNRLLALINSGKIYNTNIDIIPNLSLLLKRLRKLLRLYQSQMGLIRSSYQHYEKGDRNPSRKALRKILFACTSRVKYFNSILNCSNIVSLKKIREELNLSQEYLSSITGCSQTLISQYELGNVNQVKFKELQLSLKNVARNLLLNAEINTYIERLSLLATSDIFWDQIKSIEKIESDQEWVYDLTVNDTHNFIANGMFVHNSTLLLSVSKIAPKARYVAGRSVTGAGITASVVKDEFLRGWALEAGAMVLANKGFLMLDEMDKMSTDDTAALHEAMAQERISISKANIQATLRAETAVLSAANPKLGRFDPYQPIAAQINLPPALINRFDLIFPVRDIPNKELDEKIASHVLELHQDVESKQPDIPIELMKKYISYARQRIIPKLTKEAIEEIKGFYVTLRNSGQADENEIRPIPISARQLEALVRLAEGSARVRLSEKVTKEDAKVAIELLKNCLMQVGFDYETGQIDIDRIATGISATQRSKIVIIRELINDLLKRSEYVSMGDLMTMANERDIKEDEVDEVVERLKREGELFEPRKGSLGRVG